MPAHRQARRLPRAILGLRVGDVFGLTVRSRSIFDGFGSSFVTTFGGELTGYTKMLTASRDQARQRMGREACARGANAVVATSGHYSPGSGSFP